MSLPAGSKLGPYEIAAPLGAGGMGEVYRARDERLSRDVAIKVLPASLTSDPERLRRFEQEARATGQLNHPNILQVFDTGTHDGAPYVVSELLEGETLRARVGASPLPVRKAIDYATQVARGLAAAHEKGIVHRDLKPDNLFVTRDGRVKILDFGLAKLADPAVPHGQASHAPTATHGTDAGQVLGTVGYMSPEQVRAQPVDHRSDIFSFGAVLYEMLSGKKAFHAGSAIETMNAILKEDPAPLTATNRNLPPALERIVGHCLEKSPDERFQSARDIAFDLEQLSGASETAGLAPLSAARRARWPLFAGLGALLLGGGVALGVLFGEAGKRKTARPDFTRITFQREYIPAAYFAPDGRSIVYESEVGAAQRIAVAQVDAPGAKILDFGDATLCGVSSKGELALLLRSAPGRPGTLARVPLSGGAPRPVTENVDGCDWGPGGDDLAVLRHGDDVQHAIEFPPGKVLYRATRMRHVRVSPSGDHVAFTEHPISGDARGDVVIVDASGRRTPLSTGWADLGHLAWSRDGHELYFSGVRKGGDHSVHAVDLHGREREVCAIPGNVDVYDVAPDGRLLLAVTQGQPRIFARPPGGVEREVTWLDYGSLEDISRDGKQILFDEQGVGGGPDYSTYLRATDGSPPVRLGSGSARALSPDGRWVLVFTVTPPVHAELLPTGVGERRVLPRGPLEQFHYGAFTPDSKEVAYFANEPGKVAMGWRQSIDGGDPVPIPGTGHFQGFPSPDLKQLVLSERDGFYLKTLPDGPSRRIAGIPPDSSPFRMSDDGRFLLLRSLAPQPVRIDRLDVVTGALTSLVTLGPPASMTGGVNTIVLTDDGKAYAYNHRDPQSTLYVADGLR